MPTVKPTGFIRRPRLHWDPFERGEESIYYNNWFIEHVPVQGIDAAQAIVQE